LKQGAIKNRITEFLILDFSEWEDEGAMGEQFKNLIDGLKIFYK